MVKSIAMSLVIIFFIYVIVNCVTFFCASEELCITYQESENVDSKLIDIINEGREAKVGSWKEMNNIYDIFFNKEMDTIGSTPKKYLGSAIKIISSKDYDQSQKIYSVILMQKLPIKEYMCFMDIVNEAYEKGVVNKDVARFAILPDVNIYGTSIYYWWLPDWRVRFKKNAETLFSQTLTNDVLKGKYFFYALRK